MKQILDLKTKYPFTCKCGHHEPNVGPSIFMQAFQINSGSVSCPGCKNTTFVKLNDTNTELMPVDDVSHEQLPDACYRNEFGPFDMCIDEAGCRLLGDECKGSCQLNAKHIDEIE